MGKRLTQEKFIEKAIKTHGDKYDYSMVEYIESKNKVKIYCKECKVYFSQKPNDHLNNKGCPHCRQITKEKFIAKSNNIHNNEYDYSMINYINTQTKVEIVCKKHGIFDQKPSFHMAGYGCPKCRGKNLTTEEIIYEFRKIHGDKYDYSLVVYVNSTTKVKIICKIHNHIFDVTPASHKNHKTECPKCCESKSEILISKILNERNINFITQYTYDDCRGKKRKLQFDFYLQDYNILIEYDGGQHFERYRFEKDDIKLNIRKERDKIKNEYCLNNNIHLIRIKYDQKIEDVLTEKLFNLI